MNKVLFFSVSIGAGHDLAANAVIEALRSRYPECQTRLVDTFKYINPVLDKVISGSYMESLKFSPKIWGYLYSLAEEGEKLVDLNHILSKLVSVKTTRLINDYKPEVIVCTHAFPAGILSLLKGRGKVNAPIISVLTDYTVHPFWIHEHIDTYVIPCRDLKYHMLKYGVAEQKIAPLGVPIRKQFAQLRDKGCIRRSLGLKDITTILVMGGGLGLGEIEDIMRVLGNCHLELQIVPVTGRNEKLKAVLELIPTSNSNKVFGYVENMADLMQASDFIVTKPGGLTTAEMLAVGIPMIIVNPLPGQEERNTEFLLNNGVAVKVRRTEQLVPQLETLMHNEKRLLQIREMAETIANPLSADFLVDYIEKMLQ